MGDNLVKKMTNTIWIDVIKNCQILFRKQQFNNNLDTLNSCLWYNPQISREPLYFSTGIERKFFSVVILCMIMVMSNLLVF